MLEIMHLKEKKMAMNVRCMNMLFTKSLKALRIALAAAWIILAQRDMSLPAWEICPAPVI